MSRRSGDPAGFRGDLEVALRGRTGEERKLVLVGVLNRHLPQGHEAVLVGGALVEFYTSGAYVTGDIDLVGERDEIVPLIEGAGFSRSGRTWWSAGLELVVDVVGRDLRKTEDVVRVEFGGYSIPTVSLEDLIVDRLLAAKYWKSGRDWEHSFMLLRAHRPRVDISALRRKAGLNDVGDWAGELVAAVDGGKTRSPPSE